MSRHGSNDREFGPLMKWESVVDRAINDAVEQGAFDDLPGAGKPLDLQGNPFNPEWDSAFRTLKNAGMAPPWIEADKEVRAAVAELDARHEAIVSLRSQPTSSHQDTRSPQNRRWWHVGRFGRASPAPDPVQHTSPERNADRNRERARRQYLELTARVDAQILTGNAMLPDSLRWRERRRFTHAIAAAEFEDLWPPAAQSSEAPER